MSGHDPQEEQDWYAAYEPLCNVTPAYPPTMLLHGQSDADVPFEQAVLMAGALERAGVTHDLVSNPAWDHMFDAEGLEPPAVQQAFASVIEFLDEHVK